MASNYVEYIESTKDDIESCLTEMGCQPILFIGSGLSKRYFNGPNWEELLIEMAKQCPNITKEFAYYKQSYHSMIEIGTIFADEYKEWAWGAGRGSFPPELFDPDMPAEVYLKYKVAEYFESITPKTIGEIIGEPLKQEIKLLQLIRPHAIITTNYDRFLDMVFPEYEPIVGQQILRANNASIGEIFKIHGDVSDPESIILTSVR